MHKIRSSIFWGILFIFSSMIISSCSPNNQIPQSQKLPNESELAIAVVNELNDSINAEDFNTYMSNVHPDSVFNNTEYKNGLKTSFEQFNVRNSMSDISIEYINDEEAKVSFILMVDFNSSSFANTKIKGAYILRKNEGVWKLFSDEIDSVEPVN